MNNFVWDALPAKVAHFFLPKNIRKRGLLRYIVILIIICFKGFRFLILSSTPPVRVEWNFNKTFIFLYIFVLKYYFDFGNKLFFVIEWGCVACEGSAFFCSIFPIIFVGQFRYPSFFFSIFLYSDSQEYPKHRFLPLYEEEF